MNWKAPTVTSKTYPATPFTPYKENTMKNTVEATVKNYVVDTHGWSAEDVNGLVDAVNSQTDADWERETTTCTVEVSYTVTYSTMVYEVEVNDPYAVEESEVLEAMNVSNPDDFSWDYEGTLEYSELEIVNAEVDS